MSFQPEPSPEPEPIPWTANGRVWSFRDKVLEDKELAECEPLPPSIEDPDYKSNSSPSSKQSDSANRRGKIQFGDFAENEGESKIGHESESVTKGSK